MMQTFQNSSAASIHLRPATMRVTMPNAISVRYLIAALFMLMSSAALAQIDGTGGERLQIQLRIPEGKAAFKGADPVAIDFTLTNPTNEKVQVLVWRTPFAKEGVTENIFDVAAGRTGAAAGGGRSQVGYIGPIIKRRPPGPEDFITLGPGESRTASVNLADYYAIYQQGDYSVTYRAAPANLPPIAGDAPLASPLRKIVAPSNAVTFSVTEARTPAPKLAPALAAGSGPSFDQCTATQENDLKLAIPEARKIAAAALQILKSTPSDQRPHAARYKMWFGAHNSERYATVTSHYEQIEGAYRTKHIVIACKGSKCSNDTYAYVFPTEPYKIYVCGAFWAANISGTDSRAGTLVHEMSHFDIVAGTDDVVYGQPGAKQLATRDPDSALANADTHEYFAENEPDLPM
jgi:peptidyl-Lys metalloendopeptidase